MKIVCISDTHGRAHRNDIPDGDVLIHAGDLSLGGEIHEIQKALAWLRRFPHKYKLFIGGNHDNALAELGIKPFSDQMKPYKGLPPLMYLCDSRRTIEDQVFFGSAKMPVDSTFRARARAFMVPDGANTRFWGMAPPCDVLITHGPPLGALDEICTPFDGGLAVHAYGDAALRTYVNQVKPKLHVFGHIHCAYGITEQAGTTFVNAAQLNDHYAPANDPIVIEI